MRCNCVLFMDTDKKMQPVTVEMFRKKAPTSLKFECNIWIYCEVNSLLALISFEYYTHTHTVLGQSGAEHACSFLLVSLNHDYLQKPSVRRSGHMMEEQVEF